MRNARRRDGTGSPPVTGEPSALKGAHWVRREAARKGPNPRGVRDLAAQPTLLPFVGSPEQVTTPRQRRISPVPGLLRQSGANPLGPPTLASAPFPELPGQPGWGSYRWRGGCSAAGLVVRSWTFLGYRMMGATCRPSVAKQGHSEGWDTMPPELSEERSNLSSPR